MANPPGAIASVGEGSTDDVDAQINNVRRQELAIAQRRLAKAQAAEQKAQSVASIAGHISDSSEVSVGSGFAAQLQQQMETRQSNARQSRMDLEEHAGSVAADFANDQAVQRDNEREAADAAKEVASSFRMTVAAAAALAAGLNAVNDARKSSSESIADQRITRGQGLQRLGLDGGAQDEYNAKAESEAGPGGGLKSGQDAQFWGAAGGAYITPAIGNTQIARLKRLRDNAKIPFDVKMQIAREGLNGIATQQLAEQGLGGQGQGVAQAIGVSTDNDARETSAGAKEYASGTDVREYDSRTKARNIAGGPAALVGSAIGSIPVVGPSVAPLIDRPQSAIEAAFDDLPFAESRGVFGQYKNNNQAIRKEELEMARESIKLARERNRLARASATVPSTTGGN